MDRPKSSKDRLPWTYSRPIITHFRLGEMGKSSSSAMKKPAARKRPASTLKRPASKKPRTAGWKLGWSGELQLEGFLHCPVSFMMHVYISLCNFPKYIVAISCWFMCAYISCWANKHTWWKPVVPCSFWFKPMLFASDDETTCPAKGTSGVSSSKGRTVEIPDLVQRLCRCHRKNVSPNLAMRSGTLRQNVLS